MQGVYTARPYLISSIRHELAHPSAEWFISLTDQPVEIGGQYNVERVRAIGRGELPFPTTSPKVSASGVMVHRSGPVVTAVFEGREAFRRILVHPGIS
jgi:hypothetical protein